MIRGIITRNIISLGLAVVFFITLSTSSQAMGTPAKKTESTTVTTKTSSATPAETTSQTAPAGTSAPTTTTTTSPTAPTTTTTKPAAKPAAPKAIADRKIDLFEDGDFAANPEWWVFDNVKLVIEPNEDPTGPQGKYCVHVTGFAKGWYAGGFGAYLGIDGTLYEGVSMDIYGNGPISGNLKIELIDDDNLNWDFEQDKERGWKPVYDDRFTYEVKINWKGWKTVYIPFADFSDDTPGIGDDEWNPNQDEGSGGLIQLQFICLGNSSTGPINFKIDNIKLIGKKPAAKQQKG